MRHTIAAVVIGGALMFAPAAGSVSALAQQGTAAPVALKGRPHATTGVIKSIDDTRLVITRAGKHGDMTFGLNGSTHRYGTLDVGAPVSVRYQEDASGAPVATAITLQRAKKGQSHTASH
ncbi:MAG: hypothetical protein AB7Q29_13775 [Vicinamibacterales bacterium]